MQILTKTRPAGAQSGLTAVGFISDFVYAALRATRADITDRQRPFHAQRFRHFAHCPDGHRWHPAGIFFCFERTPTQVMLGDVRRRSHTPDVSTTHARRCTDTTTGDAPETPRANHCVVGPNGPATSVRLVHRRTT